MFGKFSRRQWLGGLFGSLLGSAVGKALSAPAGAPPPPIAPDPTLLYGRAYTFIYDPYTAVVTSTYDRDGNLLSSTDQPQQGQPDKPADNAPPPAPGPGDGTAEGPG